MFRPYCPLSIPTTYYLPSNTSFLMASKELKTFTREEVAKVRIARQEML